MSCYVFCIDIECCFYNTTQTSFLPLFHSLPWLWLFVLLGMAQCVLIHLYSCAFHLPRSSTSFQTSFFQHRCHTVCWSTLCPHISYQTALTYFIFMKGTWAQRECARSSGDRWGRCGDAGEGVWLGQPTSGRGQTWGEIGWDGIGWGEMPWEWYWIRLENRID